MKKLCIIFLLSIIIILTAVGFSDVNAAVAGANTEYLRIHVRANSNDEADQAVKYLVRDELVAYLTPIVAECTTREKAERALKSRADELSSIAKKTLKAAGFSYGATAAVEWEEFPTRVYDEYVLEQGNYLALIVRLGSGEGDNWWCVVYPPLCFAATPNTGVIYKSKIAEIIKAWKENR